MRHLQRVIGTHHLSVAAWGIYLFLMLPSFIVIPMSFGGRDEIVFPPDSFSLELYRQFFFTQDWIQATFMSFRVGLGTTLLSLLLGVPAAYGLVRGNYPGKKFVAIFLLSPILVPVIVIALGMYLYFTTLGLGGSEVSLILGHTVYVTPFVIVTSMSGLRHVDINLEHVAQIMGAHPLYTFWTVTLPLLRPALLTGGLFAFLISFDEVVIAYFLVEAGAMTLPVKMFSAIQWEISPVLAAASTILSLLSVIACLLGASLRFRDPASDG